MTSDLRADYLVTEFNAIADPAIAFTATNPPEVVDVESERADWAVFVQPFAESEEPQDRGDMSREELQVNVIVHGPLSATLTRAVALTFMKSLRDALRETEFEGYRWDGNETVSLFDFDALKTKKQFLSLFRATYFHFG
jgi:hypothetical protein